MDEVAAGKQLHIYWFPRHKGIVVNEMVGKNVVKTLNFQESWKTDQVELERFNEK